MQGGLCVLLPCLSGLHLPRLEVVADTDVQVAPSLQVLRALLFPEQEVLFRESNSALERSGQSSYTRSILSPHPLGLKTMTYTDVLSESEAWYLYKMVDQNMLHTYEIK